MTVKDRVGYDRLDIWITRYIYVETILFSRDLVKAYTLHMTGGGTVVVVAVCGEFLSPVVRDCSGQCDQ